MVSLYYTVALLNVIQGVLFFFGRLPSPDHFPAYYSYTDGYVEGVFSPKLRDFETAVNNGHGFIAHTMHLIPEHKGIPLPSLPLEVLQPGTAFGLFNRQDYGPFLL